MKESLMLFFATAVTAALQLFIDVDPKWKKVHGVAIWFEGDVKEN